MSQKLGTYKLGCAIEAILAANDAVQEDLADDGKIGVIEAASLLPHAVGLYKAFRESGAILAELEDLSELETAKLVDQLGKALPVEKFGSGADMVNRVKRALPKLVQAVQILRGKDPDVERAEPVAEETEASE